MNTHLRRSTRAYGIAFLLTSYGTVMLGCGTIQDWFGRSDTSEASQDTAATGEDSNTVPAASSNALPAEDARSRGEDLINRGEYDEAISVFTDVLNDSPADVQALYYRGVAFLEKGFPNTAIEDFTEAIKRQPDHAMAYTKRGQAYLLVGWLRSAIPDCTQAIRLQPSNAAAYQSRGMAYLRRRKFERAAADFQEVCLLQPDNAPEMKAELAKTYYLWSKDLEEDGDMDDAKSLMRRANELDATYVARRMASDTKTKPGPIERTVGRPVIPPETQDYEQQETDLSKAEDCYQRGLEYLHDEQFDAAIDALTDAIKANPALVDAYIYRGYAFLTSDLPYTAVRDFDEALPPAESRPVARAYLGRAQAFLELGNFFRARVDATEAIRLVPRSAKAFHIRGFAYLKAGKFDQAIADLEKARKLYPVATDKLKRTLACGYQERGKVHLEEGRDEKAERDFERAKQLVPSNLNDTGVAEPK